MAKRQISYCRFRPAELGLAGILRIVLAFIGLLLIGCLVNYLKNGATNNQEGMLMNTRMKKGIQKARGKPFGQRKKSIIKAKDLLCIEK